MSATHPRTTEEWATFLESDRMPLTERLALVAGLAWDERRHEPDTKSDAYAALHAIIPGDKHATPAVRQAVEQITGRQIDPAAHNTAPACRAALMRWAARTA